MIITVIVVAAVVLGMTIAVIVRRRRSTTRRRSARRDPVGLFTVWSGDLNPDLPTTVLPRVEERPLGRRWAPLTRDLGARLLEGLRNL